LAQLQRNHALRNDKPGDGKEDSQQENQPSQQHCEQDGICSSIRFSLTQSDQNTLPLPKLANYAFFFLLCIFGFQENLFWEVRRTETTYHLDSDPGTEAIIYGYD
jgi:hypothetical protein